MKGCFSTLSFSRITYYSEFLTPRFTRPSNARIRQLETENSRLRESLSQDAPSLRQNTSPVNYEYPHPSSCNEQTPTTRLGNPENAQLPSPSTSNLGTPRSIPRRPEQGHLFLGPSGIDLSSGRPAEAEASAEPETNVADGPARNQLVGHTARQRKYRYRLQETTSCLMFTFKDNSRP